MLNVLVTFVGLFLLLSGTTRAPAVIKMILSYETEKELDEYKNIEMEITIRSVSKRNIIYANKNNFNRSPDKSKTFELSLSFHLENISESLLFIGKLTPQFSYFDSEESKIHEFKNPFSYNVESLKMINGYLSMTKTFYSTSIVSLDVIISASCKDHYYPENICNKPCYITPNTKRCDRNGDKYCEREYYLNVDNQNCERDWCLSSGSQCLNGGTCVNMVNKFRCNCVLSYQGANCQEYSNRCLRFVCPNETFCMVQGERISCLQIPKIQNPLSSTKGEVRSLSVMTMAIVVTSIVVMSIGFCVTVWACKIPRYRKYKNRSVREIGESSSEESVNNKPSSYRNNIDTYSEQLPPQTLRPEHIHCACKLDSRQPYYVNGNMDNYYSLRYPNGRGCCRPKRTNSDLYISKTNGRLSMTSSTHTATSNNGDDCETLPLPPPIESDNLMNDIIIL